VEIETATPSVPFKNFQCQTGYAEFMGLKLCLVIATVYQALGALFALL